MSRRTPARDVRRKFNRNLCTILKRWSLRAIRPKCNVMHSEGLTSTGPAAWNFCLRQNARKWTTSFLKRKIKKKIWGVALNYTGFACKTGSWTVKNTIQNAPRHHIESQNQFFFWGTAPPQPLPRWGRDTPRHTPPPRRLRRLDPRACVARPRPWALGASSSPHLCSCKLTVKKPWH